MPVVHRQVVPRGDFVCPRYPHREVVPRGDSVCLWSPVPPREVVARGDSVCLWSTARLSLEGTPCACGPPPGCPQSGLCVSVVHRQVVPRGDSVCLWSTARLSLGGTSCVRGTPTARLSLERTPCACGPRCPHCEVPRRDSVCLWSALGAHVPWRLAALPSYSACCLKKKKKKRAGRWRRERMGSIADSWPLFFSTFQPDPLPRPVPVPAGSPSRGGDVAVYVFVINQPSLPIPFFKFCSCVYFCLFDPYSCISSHNLPTTLHFLTLFFRSYFCLIGPFNYISLYESPSALI